jgi:hypothetical protein
MLFFSFVTFGIAFLKKSFLYKHLPVLIFRNIVHLLDRLENITKVNETSSEVSGFVKSPIKYNKKTHADKERQLGFEAV